MQQCTYIAAALVCLTAVNSHGLEIKPSPDGDFLTAWHVIGPLGRKSSEQLLTAGEPGGDRWRTLNSPGIGLNVGRALRPRAGYATWFGAVLVAEKPTDIVLKLGCDGTAEVFLDGTSVTRHERPNGALWDNHISKMTIPAGRHSLLIKTMRRKKQKGGRHWTLICRIHDEAGKPPKGLKYELPGATDAARLAAEGTRLHVDRELTPNGYRVNLQLRLEGSMPKTVNVPYSATISPGKRVIGQGNLGDSPTMLDVSLDHDDTYQFQVTAGGRRWTQKWIHRQYWNNQLTKAFKNLKKAPKGPFTQATLDTVRFNLEKLQRHVLEGIKERKWLTTQITKVSRWAKTLRDGHDPFGTLRGDYYRAYTSPYDGNLQKYSVHIPRSYNRNKRWPLVIGMHGIGSGTHYTLRRVLGRDRDKEKGEPGGKPLIRNYMPRLPNLGVLTACAWGYHNSAFWFYGENDVMRVIDEMKAAFRIDPDRVYLTGLSLGGLGTYHIGHHFPDQFAALGPLGGFSSVKLYRQIRQHPKTPWETVLIEQRDATTYAENGRHTPMKVIHGRKDGPRHATAMTNKYAKHGYKYELEIPDMGHDVWQYSYGEKQLVRWMKRFKRPTAPDEVVLKTHSYRYIKAYWTRIGWIPDYKRPALLRVNIKKRNRSEVVVTTVKNLRGITLDLTRPKLNDGPITIRFKESGEEIEVPRRQVVHLRRNPGSEWKLADSASPPRGHKKPGVSGPVDDIMYDPHTFVVGTGDPAQTDVNRRLVAEDHTYLRHKEHDIWFPVVDDTQLTESDLRDKNLVLYGNPKSNRVLKKFLATGKVPLAFDSNGITLAGKRYEGDDVGIKMIFPNPYNPDRVFIVVAGVTWRGTLLSRHLPRFVPDVIVYDNRLNKRYYTRILIDRPVRFGGFFKSNWTL